MNLEQRKEALVAQKTQEAMDAKAAIAAAMSDAAKFHEFTRLMAECFDNNLDYTITEKKLTPRNIKLYMNFAQFNVKTWNAFVTTYANTATGLIDVEGLALPIPRTDDDKMNMYHEFSDMLLPYLFWRHHVAMPDFLYGEGPYELGAVELHPGDVVLDCGANVGLFSAMASRKGCVVHAFEPMDYTRATYLERTAELNPNITIHPMAVGAEEADVEFTLDTANIGGSHQHRDGDNPEMPVQKAHVTTVDKFVKANKIKRVDFIKADIEGAERHMLQGAAATIRKHHPMISICTYHLPDDPKVLRALIQEIEPKYKIVEKFDKMYAWI